MALVYPRKIDLARTPTPLQFLERASRKWGRGHRLWVKRDDLTGCALSGNKVRKLEFITAYAIDNGYDTLLTCGGLQSNHCRATALAGAQLGLRVHLLLASMDRLPFAEASFDFVVAHGIWNLARSGDEFRRAVDEAARVARPGCALFLFTFSRHTLTPQAEPLPGETFVFTQFSGQPQCFLTDEQIITELGARGFAPDTRLPLRELNLPPKGAIHTSTAPVIYEGVFRRV